MSSIVVVGAGIAGISSALAIQERRPHAKITVIAADFSPNLTSDIAAGFWLPYLVNCSQPDLLSRLCRETFDYIASLVDKEDAGAIWQSGHELSREQTEIPPWASIVRGFRRLSQEELDRFGNGYKSGHFFTTIALEPTTYITYATKEFLSNGGIIKQGKVANLRDLADEFGTIINCTGIGAREVVGDDQVVPIRGQVIRVRAPRVKHFFDDGDYYCLLNSNFVVLGGTHDENEWNTEVNEETAKRILEENGAEIISHHVGLRPYRSFLRIEKETIRSANGRKATVVHNYGHGGSGVTVFWGCALRVAELLEITRSSI